MATDIQNSVLRYAGIDIPYLKTEKFLQEPVWSADGTDLLYTHIVIGVSGVLNSCFLNGNDPSKWIELNRSPLLQRGGQLYFFIGGTQVMPPAGAMTDDDTEPTTGHELVASPAYKNPSHDSGTNIGAMLDAKLGPKPIHLDIRAIRGGTYTIYYEIETWIPYCFGGGTPSAVLSNRWECAVELDKDYFFTRTTNGILVLNSQVLQDGKTPSSILSTVPNNTLIFPPLFRTWKRDVIKTTLSSDQLTLTYSIVDRQQYVSVPKPAIHIDATYAEITPAGNAPNTGIAFLNVQQCNIDVTVTGDPGTQIPSSYPTGTPTNPDRLKYTLLKIMWQVVFSRIQFPFPRPGTAFKDTGEMITHCELREDLFKPIVGCRIVSRKTRSQTQNIFGSSANDPDWTQGVFKSTMIGAPILLDDAIAQIATQPVSLGSWATYLLLSSVDPKYACGTPTVPEVSGNYLAPPTTVYTSQIVTTNTSIGTAGATLATTSTSNATYNYPFTDYTATVDYHINDHVVQLPTMYDVEQMTTSGTTKASSVFCQTASPTSQKIIHWRASRLGAWPRAPKPSAVDVYGGSLPADRTISQVIQMGEVELSNDHITRHYSLSGQYVIGMARRLQWDATGILSTICNPVIGSSTYGDIDASYPTSGFIDGILNAGPSPGNLIT